MTPDTRYDAGSDHIVKRFVTVPNREKMAGDAFPLVMDNGGYVNAEHLCQNTLEGPEHNLVKFPDSVSRFPRQL